MADGLLWPHTAHWRRFIRKYAVQSSGGVALVVVVPVDSCCCGLDLVIFRQLMSCCGFNVLCALQYVVYSNSVYHFDTRSEGI